jgi:hypothetical protein
VKRSYRSHPRQRDPRLGTGPGMGPAPPRRLEPAGRRRLPTRAGRRIRGPLVVADSGPGRLRGRGRLHPRPRPGPNLSTRGLLTIALAAAVIVLLSVHRAAGPARLARATAEYTVVAVLTALLVLAGGLDQPPSNPAGSAATAESKQAGTSEPNLEAGDGQPGVLRVAAAVTWAVTKAIRAVTGAVGWLVDLWRQADANTDRTNRSPSTTTPNGEAMAPSPTLTATSTRRPR